MRTLLGERTDYVANKITVVGNKMERYADERLRLAGAKNVTLTVTAYVCKARRRGSVPEKRK